MDNLQLVAKYGNKPAGVYREIIDSSRQADVPAPASVVVVIQSKQGPVMNPIYCKDATELHAIFGKRDIRLEQRGNFGILMAEHVLEQGPIWVLNVKNINKHKELLETVHIPINTHEVLSKEEVQLSKVYDTTNFWKLSKFYAKHGLDNAGLTFTAVLNDTISVIVQKQQVYPEYQYTVGETKALNENFTGAGLNEQALVSDYMITVHVFKSDIAKELKNVGNKNCFKLVDGVLVAEDIPGSKESSIEAAKELPELKFFKTYTGTVGDVIDKSGKNLNIAIKMNADVLASGVACAVNVDAMFEREMDLAGIENLEKPMPVLGFPSLFDASSAEGVAFVKSVLRPDNIIYHEQKIYAQCDDNREVAEQKLLSSDLKIGTNLLFKGTSNSVSAKILDKKYVSANKHIEDFDTVVGTKAVPVDHNKQPYKLNARGIPVYPDNHPMAKQPVQFSGDDKPMDFKDGEDTLTEVDASSMSFSPEETAAIAEIYGVSRPLFELTLSKAVVDHSIDFGTPVAVQVALYGTLVTPFNTDAEISLLSLPKTQTSPVHTMHGIVDIEKHYVNGTPARQNDVLTMLTEQSVIDSFSDINVFRCRYMVDSFKTYIEPNSKWQYGKLASQAKRFPVFIPAPFYHELLVSKNPDFHDRLGQFRIDYVRQGFNPDKLSTNTFNYANNDEAGPWLIPIMNVDYNDGFSDTVIPATGAVAKLYYAKHTGTHKVYDIVAGPEWPVNAQGLVGPEKQFDMSSRAHLEKMGTNILQKIDGKTQLRSSLTAFQSVNSAINAVETIEKFLYVTDMTEPVIISKMFKYNNIDSRTACKNQADKVCDQMLADGAISDYENICDLSNNTKEVRSRGILVLDTILYNEYGIRIGVHRNEIRLPKK